MPKWSSWVIPIFEQWIRDGGRPPYWKKRLKLLYLRDGLADIDKIWHGDVVKCVKPKTATAAVLKINVLHCRHSIRRRVYVTVGRPSVSLSYPAATRRCCGFAAVGPAARRYRSIAARSAGRRLVGSRSCAVARHAAANERSAASSADIGTSSRTDLFACALVTTIAQLESPGIESQGPDQMCVGVLHEYLLRRPMNIDWWPY